MDEALAKEAARLGVEVRELAERSYSARICSARRTVAARLRAKGYRLHEIAHGLGRKEAAVCGLLQRRVEAGQHEEKEVAQLELLPVTPGSRVSEELVRCERSAE